MQSSTAEVALAEKASIAAATAAEKARAEAVELAATRLAGGEVAKPGSLLDQMRLRAERATAEKEATRNAESLAAAEKKFNLFKDKRVCVSLCLTHSFFYFFLLAPFLGASPQSLTLSLSHTHRHKHTPRVPLATCPSHHVPVSLFFSLPHSLSNCPMV